MIDLYNKLDKNLQGCYDFDDKLWYGILKQHGIDVRNNVWVRIEVADGVWELSNNIALHLEDYDFRYL